MERDTMVTDGKIQYCKDVRAPQVNLHTQQFQSKFRQDLCTDLAS